MLILTIRTDNPIAEICLYNDNTQLACTAWEAHRQLAETLHTKLEELLTDQYKTWSEVQGIVIYKGPGSFTGLRIGGVVANTLSNSFAIPIVGTNGDGWIVVGINALLSGENAKIVYPEYGAEARTTKQLK